MTTPQQPAKRLKQKRRREKQLAKWRDKQPDKTLKSAPAPKAPAKKPAAKTEK